MIRILLADDHPMIRTAIEVLLRDTQFELAATAMNGAEALTEMTRLKPDILLVDLEMPELGGMAVIRKLPRFVMRRIAFCDQREETGRRGGGKRAGRIGSIGFFLSSSRLPTFLFLFFLCCPVSDARA